MIRSRVLFAVGLTLVASASPGLASAGTPNAVPSPMVSSPSQCQNPSHFAEMSSPYTGYQYICTDEQGFNRCHNISPTNTYDAADTVNDPTHDIVFYAGGCTTSSYVILCAENNKRNGCPDNSYSNFFYSSYKELS